MPKEEHVCRVSLEMPKVECGGRLLCARGFAVVLRVGHARALRSVWRSTWSSGVRGSVMWACNVASVHGAVCRGHKDGAALFVTSGSCLGRSGPSGSRLSRACFVDAGRHCCAIVFCFFFPFLSRFGTRKKRPICVVSGAVFGAGSGSIFWCL